MAVPLPYRVTARRGGEPVADTRAAVRIDFDDRAPQLWFPAADVSAPDAAVLEAAVLEAGAGPPQGHLLLSDDTAIEIHDPTGAVDDEAPTVAFPNWGDAADLMALLDVSHHGDGAWGAPLHPHWQRPLAEGSQLLAQSIVAGCRHAPGRRVVHTTMVFSRAVSTSVPAAIELDEVSGGRTFSALGSAVVQGGRTCAFGSLLLDAGAPDLIRHQAEAPPGAPGEAAHCDMGITGRALRVVDGAYSGDPDAPTGPPHLAVWVRFAEVPDDPAMHAALLAHFSGDMSIAAALRPHSGIGADQAHVAFSSAVNAISLSFHAEVRADRWMRYDHRSSFAGDGMTHSECRVHDQDGRLLASFTVDSMLRAFAGGRIGADPKTAL